MAGVAEQLESHNSIRAVKYKGSRESTARSACRTYTFRNKRAEPWWRFREALDPNQPGGSPIALPNDPIIRADLAAPRFLDTIHGIQIEEKAEIAKRLGRSPDAGDAIVLAWSEGQAAIRRGISGPGSEARRRDRPQFANMGYSAQKARLRGRSPQPFHRPSGKPYA